MSVPAGPVAASAAAAAARSGLPSSLEYFQNVVTEGEESNPSPSPASPSSDAVSHGELELAKCGCSCWYCPDCCEVKGYNLRARLIPVLTTFCGLMMLTLTVDPLLFASPKDAYLYIRKRRAISRLMQDLHRRERLHSRRYFYVVEFQRETEQAHFHVLIDATFVPKDELDAAWSKNRPPAAGPVPDVNRPAFGMTRYSAPRFADAAHAGRYATKYLVKSPEEGWPAWVLAMGATERLPRYGTSRGFWGISREIRKPSGKSRGVVRTTYEGRIAGCGSTCNLFRVTPVTGTPADAPRSNREFLHRLDVHSSVLPSVWQAPGGSRRRVTLRTKSVSAAIAAIAFAAGHPVRVIGGIVQGGRA